MSNLGSGISQIELFSHVGLLQLLSHVAEMFCTFDFHYPNCSPIPPFSSATHGNEPLPISWLQCCHGNCPVPVDVCQSVDALLGCRSGLVPLSGGYRLHKVGKGLLQFTALSSLFQEGQCIEEKQCAAVLLRFYLLLWDELLFLLHPSLCVK